MGFEKIIGQETVRESLIRTVKSGNISHAYLFSGPPGSGKKTLAQLFAQALNCDGDQEPPCQQCLPCRKILHGNHPDLHVLKPQGASLKIGQLREVKERLYLLTVEGRKKVCIIHDAELMTLPAANSLLKILEEPPENLVFILLTARPGALPPTVLSRCVQFALAPLGGDKMGQILGKHGFADPKEREVIMALSGGNPGKSLEMVSQGDWENSYREALSLVKSIEEGPGEGVLTLAAEYSRKKDLQEVLAFLLFIYRNRLVCKLGGPENSLKDYFLRQHHKNGVGSLSGVDTAQSVKIEEHKNAVFLEKICRALVRMQGELHYNVNLRLALEVLFLKMRGVV